MFVFPLWTTLIVNEWMDEEVEEERNHAMNDERTKITKIVPVPLPVRCVCLPWCLHLCLHFTVYITQNVIESKGRIRRIVRLAKLSLDDSRFLAYPKLRNFLKNFLELSAVINWRNSCFWLKTECVLSLSVSFHNFSLCFCNFVSNMFFLSRFRIRQLDKVSNICLLRVQANYSR